MPKSKILIAVATALVLATAAPALAAASTDLGVAASTGDTGRIKALLGQGQNINVRDAEGYTPIMWAALNGQVNAVSTLITLGANLNVQDREGYTALMWATQNKHLTIVRQLVNAGASVNLRDNHGYAALHWAAQDGQLAAAQLLLSRGADPNVRDSEGYTPLMWAAQQGHNAVVYELLTHNANPGFRDKRGYTAYDLANAYYHPEIRRMIQGYKPAAPATAARPAASAPSAARQYTAADVKVVDSVTAPDPVAPVRVAPSTERVVDTRRLPVAASSRVTYRGDANLRPIALVQPQRDPSRPVQTTTRVPIRSAVKPKLLSQPTVVAVVNTPDAVPGAAPMQAVQVIQPAPAEDGGAKSAWWGAAAKLAKFDVDRNKTIDGRDWRNLTMTTSKIALAQLLWEGRGGKRAELTTEALNRIINKLDWVYGQPERRLLTLNQAYDMPAPQAEGIRW